MSKEKVTLTLDADRLATLRRLVGSRSLSASVDEALLAHVAHLEHLAAVDGWLAEMDAAHGPVPDGDLEWAEQVVARWEAGRPRRPAAPPR